MQTKQASPVLPADPIGSFLSSLPRKAIVKGFKWIQTSLKSELYVSYSLNGEVVSTSISVKGGQA